MSNYTRQHDFSVKDSLSSGDPDKLIKGSQVDEEFDSLVTHVATKQDVVSGAVANRIATLNSSGVVQDSGKLITEKQDQDALLDDIAALTMAKGDILVSDGTDIQKLQASTGSDGDALILDSSESTGVKWGGAVEVSTEIALQTSLSGANNTSGAHGLSGEPQFISIIAELRAGQSDLNYSAGDRVNLSANPNDTGANRAWSVWADATNVYIAWTEPPRIAYKNCTSNSDYDNMADNKWDITAYAMYVS